MLSIFVKENQLFNPVTRPKNPIMKSIIAIAVPALMCIGTAAHAKCVTCTEKENTAKVFTVKSSGNTNLVKLNPGNGFIISSKLKQAPFITVPSMQFIEELGNLYTQKCREKKIGEWPFVITSVGKTNEAINNLSHQSTAIRISWTRFGKEELQSQAHLNTLIEALMEMREKETCFVKLEGKQACFRILVNEARVEGMHVVARN